jgi:hypothetical protein
VDRHEQSGCPAKLAGVSCTSAGLCVASARPGGLSYGSIITTTTPATGGSGWTEAPVQATISLFGISCPSASLCFAVDTRGDLLNSRDPTGGTVWAATNVTGTNLYGIACPSVSLCVGVDYTGNVLTSANPTGDHSAWTSASVDGRIPINAVACPSAGLCVAVDDAGNVLTSTDPTGGAAAWHLVNIDGTTPMGAVACASTTMCVAGDDRGNVIASTDPTGGSAAWHAAQVDGTNSFNGVSCPSTTLCAAVDDVGNVVTATDPTGGAAAWRAASVDAGNPLTAVSCSSPSQCVAVDASGNEINSIDPAGGDPAWTGTQVGVSPSPLGGPGPSPLQAISCPIESYCIAVDGYGYAFVGKPTPSNLTPPSISGGDVVGGVLEETNGSWTDSPTSSDVYWESCDSTGDHCSLIQGASGQTYTLTSADLGRTIRAIEVASNANGDGTPVESNPSAVVTLPQPPTSTSPPRIAGTATQGQRLSETHGSWTNSPTTYHYQWSDCDVAANNCASTATATGQTYTLTAADVGHTIRVEEIAGNVGGSSAPTTSAPTGVVQVPSGTSGALTAGRASVSGPSARLSVSCIGGPGATCKLTLALTITETVKAGKVVAVTATKRNGTKPKRKIVTLSTTTITLTAGQAENVQLGLNGTGKRLLVKYHTLKVKLLITESGRTVSAQTITFKAIHQKKKH